ncbi:MAG: 3-oxoadipate enol-lactonase [Nocardioidaceae bacterium]
MTSQIVALNHYTQGPPDAPAVFLGGSLGTTLSMWDSLAGYLAPAYHVVRFDIRGHGSSPTPAGPYSMSELAGDVIALADELELERFAYVGLSLGGAIGLTLAVEHPERLTSLVLCCAAPVFGEPETWRERSARVTAEGTGWLVETTRDRWFTRGFQEAHPVAVHEIVDMLATASPVGYAACCDALASFDLTARLDEVKAPTRVVAAAQDPVTPPDVTQLLADGISGADHVVIDYAAHIANIAQPEEFNRAVKEHLDRTSGA